MTLLGPSHEVSDINVQKLAVNSALGSTPVRSFAVVIPDMWYSFQNLEPLHVGQRMSCGIK